MVHQWLVRDIEDVFARNPHARVLLWFDKENEFSRLLDAAALDGAPFRLLRYQVDKGRGIFHGAFWLKTQIEWEPRDLPEAEREALRFVVHIPLRREALDEPRDVTETSLECLLEYKHSGKVWLLDGYAPTLFTFLRYHGVPLPDARAEQQELWEGGADSILARFVARFRDRDPDFWHQPLDAARIRELILGSLDEELLPLLADPTPTVARLRATELWDDFVQGTEAEFGFSDGLADDPAQWADRFTIRLALNECFEACGRPDDFPYKALLPPETLRPRHLAFLRRWMSDHDYGEAFALRMPPLEAAHDLREWARGRQGDPVSFLSLAQAKWQEFATGLQDVAGSRSAAAEYLATNERAIAIHGQSFWARRTDRLPGWGLAAMLAHLVAAAQEAADSAVTLTEPRAFVTEYAETWHDVDATYWELSAGVRKTVGMEALQAVADLAYVHYLQTTNEAFRRALNGPADWAAWGDDLASRAARALWTGSGRRAILVVDALRYDLAERLTQKRGGGQAAVEPWVAAIPATTPVGMTALLPDGLQGLTAVLASGKLCLEHPQFGDLAVKENRRKLLRARVQGVEVIELSDLRARTQAPRANVLVVFTGDIDTLGHGVGCDVVEHLETLLSSVDSAIGRLQEWGYPDVHVVTDHGFLLCPEGSEKDDLPSVEAIVTDKRHAFLAEATVTARPVVPFPFDTRQRLVFAEGLRSFTAGAEFLHGGLSLQEVVIPHVHLHVEAALPRLSVKLKDPPTEIVRNPLSLYVVTVGPQQASLGFEEPAPRNVEFDLLRDPTDLGSSVCMQRKPEQFTTEDLAGPRRITLFLDHGKTPAAGGTVYLYMRDADNDAEDLAPGVSFTLAADI